MTFTILAHCRWYNFVFIFTLFFMFLYSLSVLHFWPVGQAVPILAKLFLSLIYVKGHCLKNKQ